MESILILTHADETGAELTRASLEAITAGQQLSERIGAQLAIGIVAADAQHLSKGLPCASLAVSGEAFGEPRYATDAAACEALCRAAQATIILAPHSSRFARVMAGVAHRLGGAIDTHIMALAGADAIAIEASRSYYRQRIESVITRTARPWLLLLDPGTHSSHVARAGTGTCEQIHVEMQALRTTVSGVKKSGQSGADDTIRPDAKLLFVAGAGWTKKQPDGQLHTQEAANLILDFLRASSASLGSSKSLVDQGGDGHSVLPFLTHLNQVGQTGSTPRHPKGLSTCCHGEEPHVVGWRFIAERRAISLDPNCGWTRGKADVVYIADAFQVIEKLNELLAAHRS
jgi:electron transfer flavoprotein alpha subunit